MARQRRQHRLAVRLTDAEHGELHRRADEHGVPMAEFVRRTALAKSPLVEQSADAWWDSLSAERRGQVMGWLTKRPADPFGGGPPPLPLPLDLTGGDTL